MTIHQTPRDVLSRSIKPALPPKRWSEEDSLLVSIRDQIARAQNIPSLRADLATLLADCLHEIQLERISRTHPGMIGVLTPECEFAKIEG